MMKETRKPTESKSSGSSNTHVIINSIIVGVLIGLTIFALFRFITYKPAHTTHYHANWEVWIKGNKQTFPESIFYQEVASCSINDDTDPLHRSHMHEGVYNVIHVHANGVTYGQFLENINSSAQTGYLNLAGKVYQNNTENTVTYILNGRKIDSLNGVVIRSEDKLLINYGNESDTELIARDRAIANTANEFNHKQDPTSCSGNHTTTLQDRLNSIIY